MEEQLISFETAKLAKERGFNIESNHQYFSKDGKKYQNQNGTKATLDCLYCPTKSFLQKWLRTEHKINIEITDWSGSGFFKFEIYDLKNWNRINLIPIKWSENNDYHKENKTSSIFDYEEALEIGLQQTLSLIR